MRNVSEKTCITCRITKKLDKFRQLNKPNGNVYYCNQCIACDYEYRNKKRRTGRKTGRPSVYSIDENGVKERKCTVCLTKKQITEFQKKGSNSRGIKYDIICKQCYSTSEIKEKRNRLQRKYMKTLRMKEWVKDYYSKQEIKDRYNQWQRTDRKLNPNKYSEYDIKHLSKRRGLDITRPLNKKFKDSRCHHLLTDEYGIPDNGIVYYIPKEDHIINHHEDTTGEGMIKINKTCLMRCIAEHNKKPSELTKKNIVILKKIIKKTKERVKEGWISYRGATKEEICAYIGIQTMHKSLSS